MGSRAAGDVAVALFTVLFRTATAVLMAVSQAATCRRRTFNAAAHHTLISAKHDTSAHKLFAELSCFILGAPQDIPRWIGMCRQDGVEGRQNQEIVTHLRKTTGAGTTTHQHAVLAASSHIGKQRLCNTKQLKHGRAVFCFGTSTAGSHLLISDVHQLSLHVTEE